MTADITALSEQVLEGSFLARATYGAEYIASAYWVGGDGDAEKNDDYRGYAASQGFTLLDASSLPTFNGNGGDAYFTPNGLYDARVTTLFTDSFDAQGLLGVHDHTLVMAFRGTDGEDPAVLSGQAFTGMGIAANYKAFRPLINAAYDYVAAHPEITDIVVSGHSLGGAMADVFTLVDADRFRALRPDHLTIVSLGSSGVPPDLPNYLDGIDTAAATIHKTELIPFSGIYWKEITSIVLPPDHVSFADSQDRAHFPNNYPDIPESLGLVPIVTLKANLQFGGDTIFDVPNIHNADVVYYDPLDHPQDFRGMGAEHSSALLWANVQGLVSDELFHAYSGQKLIVGITDYNAVPDFNGTPLPLFAGYLKLDSPTIMNDKGTHSLIGTVGADYILGLAGDDNIEGRGGRDILSGGSGNDILSGGGGADMLAGGSGADVLFGGARNDRFVFTCAADSAPGQADTIGDFQLGIDHMLFRAFDADPLAAGRQPLTFVGTGGFSGEGQIRAVQSGDDTMLRINLTADPGAEMVILLKHIAAADLTSLDFIL